MTLMPILILLTGLFLIWVEFYLPGAIMGVLGAIAVCLSIVLFASQAESAWETLLFFLVAAALVAGLCKYMLWKIPRSRGSSSIYSSADQTGYQASNFDAAAIGKTAIAFTDLKPGGLILFEGKRLAAISQSGYLIKGTDVLIIGGEGESLIVKAAHPTPPKTNTYEET